MFNMQNYKNLHKKFNRKKNDVYSHKLQEHIFNTCKQYAEMPSTTWKSDNNIDLPKA